MVTRADAVVELGGDADRGDLELADLVRIADGAAVAVPGPVMAALADAHTRAREIRARGGVYGQSTGVGANKAVAVAADEWRQGMRLLRSHAAGTGPVADARTTRAMLAIRINQLCRAGSGIDPAVVAGMVTMLDTGALPLVRVDSGVGTADLSALATVGLTLAGERPATAPLDPIGAISSDSALPLMSSSALTLAGTLLQVARLEEVLDAAEGAFVLSCTALRANTSPLAPAAARAVAVHGAQELAHRLRGALRGVRWDPHAVQDSYGFRAYVPSQSVALRAVSRLRDQALALCSTAQENPLFTPEGVLHHGAFLQTALAQELSSTCRALAQTTTLTMSRIRMLNDPVHSGLPGFLSTDEAGASGTIILEYVAGSGAAMVLGSVTDLASHSVVISQGMEEDASFVGEMLRGLTRAVEGMEVLVACEFLEAVRALRLRGGSGHEGPVGDLFAVGDALGEDTRDRDLQEDVDTARALVSALGRTMRRVAGRSTPPEPTAP